MLFGRSPVTPRAKERKTKIQRRNKNLRIFGLLILSAILSFIVFKSFAEIIDANDVQVDVDSELTYYLNVKEDGIDVRGIESSDTQVADVLGGRVTVTDKLPDGLVFQGFVTTSDGTIGAVSRADKTTQCPGKVVDDTNEASLDAGTWNNDHTEYYYHGLHYNNTTRTVSFVAEKIKAGCELTVGIITKTPATVDNPDTDTIEFRRDFYNKAFVAEKDVTAISNTAHAFIGDSGARLYDVVYDYEGDVPAGAPATPGDEAYVKNYNVSVSANPTLEGYTFSGWTTEDATVTGGSFSMPGRNVRLVGVWTRNSESTKYTVTYVINGDKPTDFMPPATKEYEAGVSVPLDSTEANANIDGYRFSGWSTTDAELSETGFTMPAQNVTIIGSFERISYTVCYEFEGAIMPDNASSILSPCETHYPGDTVTTANSPQADGYVFLGWYKNASFKMPEENVIIRGEWGRAMGKFAPTIAKTIVNPKDEYMYGETVKFKITVTNTAAYEITDVFLQEELDGAIFTVPADDSYTVKTNTVAVIPSIPAGASVDVYAEYKVTENVAQTLTNTVELTGALAEDNVLDTDQEYKATINFDTIPEPAPFTGVIFNALPYMGLIVLSICIILVGIVISRKANSLLMKLVQIRSLKMDRALKYSILCLVVVGILVGGIIIRNVSAENYTEVIKSIELTSQHTNYVNNEPGAWHTTKSAKWIEQGKARITFDVDTIAKLAEGVQTDIVMVLDNSGSMSGDKLAQVKHDATELIESVLSDSSNQVALVNFNSSATILSELTNDVAPLFTLIDGLNATGCTNYYNGLLKAEEILDDYVKQENRELILLFLTDGYPNEQISNEIAEYQALKAKYPYMTINGIQYEMGDEVLEPVKRVSDNQFIANMDSLNNVLFEASVTPYTYETFTLTDYINDEYWDVESIDKIEASIGEASLAHDGDMPVVTWTMNEVLTSGRSAQLTIDITLKDAGVIPENTFLPTNDHEMVQSKLSEVQDENISSELTPVLKSSYKVTYEPNLPSGCSSYESVLPEEQAYPPLSIVEKSSTALSCNGYNFNGWDIASGDPKLINDDYFKIISDDVVLRATWTKVSISKSMDGEVKEEVVAILSTGSNINVALKKLSGQNNPNYSSINSTIVAVKLASVMSSAQQANASVISTSNSPVPIYAWFNDTDGTIYIYSEANKIKANTSLARLFYGFNALEDISALAGWDTSNVVSMESAFYDASSLSSVEYLANWNTSKVTSMSSMFSKASSLTNVDGLADWDTSKVTEMSSMFYLNRSLTDISGLADWDVSNVKKMNSMFNAAVALANIDGLSNWNTSSVTSMASMFHSATSLTNIDGAINWDTSSVTNMAQMFYNATGITNIDGALNWDTSKVTEMGSMFNGASSLTNIDGALNWDTSKVTGMNSMFRDASSLTNIDGALNWDTSKVTNMTTMFYSASSLADIGGASGWDTSSVTTMRGMFGGASSLAIIDGALNWDVSKVTDMSEMFYSASGLTNIGGALNWDTSSVTTMKSMFYGASNLTNIDGALNWDVSKVTDMAQMFYNTSRLANINGAINWDTSSVTTMGSMFQKATALVDIDGALNWDTSSVTNMVGMFANASSLTNINGARNWDTSSVNMMSTMFSYASSLVDISGAENWDTSNVTTMNMMFYYNRALSDISVLSNWDVSNATVISSMFSNDTNITDLEPLADWDTSKVSNMSSVFANLSNITDVDDLADWDTSNVTDMSSLFSGTSKLVNINGISGWDTSNVTTMSTLFSNSKITNLNALENWDTSKVTYMSSMFYGATSLNDISAIEGWDVSNVTSMADMFWRTTSLTDISALASWNTSSLTSVYRMFRESVISDVDVLTNWETSNLTNIGQLFYDAPNLTDINGISGWDTSSVKNMELVFHGVTGLTDMNALSSWNTSSVTTMYQMFYGASNLADISGLSSWNVSNVTNMTKMFYGASSITSLQPIFGWTVQSSTTKTSMFDSIPTSIQRPDWY